MTEPKTFAPLPLSPGDVLQSEFVDRRGVTQERLARALGVSRYSVNQILNDRRNITADMALRLSQVLSTTPDFWLNLQREVDLYRARLRLGSTLDELEVLNPSIDGPPLASKAALFGISD